MFFNLSDSVITVNGQEIDGWGSNQSVFEIPNAPNLGAATSGGSGHALYSTTKQRQVDVVYRLQVNTASAKFMGELAEGGNAELNGTAENTNTGLYATMVSGAFVDVPKWVPQGSNGEVGDLVFTVRYNRVYTDWSGLQVVDAPEDPD